MPPFSLHDAFSPGGLAALVQVVLIDLSLAGDNVLVLGTLVAGLPPLQRRRALLGGVALALVCTTGCAILATRLLHVVGLLFAGGLLLLWVAWRLWREFRHPHAPPASGTVRGFGGAALRIALADLSMSLDNVLAVAGVARDHPAVLVFGLSLSVVATAAAAGLIARVIARYRWIGLVGIAVIVVVAVSMMVQGWRDPSVGLGLVARCGFDRDCPR